MTELALPSGTRMTAQRRAVLDAIEASNGPFTAIELFERARRAHARLGLATTYRTLELLRRTGSLHALPGAAVRALLARSITTISSVSAAAPWRTPSCARLPRSKRSHAGTASAPSRTSSRSTAPAGTACELDRDPARLADRPVHAGRRDRRSAAASRADDADRAHGRDRDRSRALRGAAGGDRRGRQRRPRHRARRPRLPDLLPRRAGARPAPPRRRGSGSRSRAGRRAGRGGALDAQLHRRPRDRPRVRRQHDDRDPRVRRRRRARLRGRHEHGQLHPQPERQPAAGDDLARCRMRSRRWSERRSGRRSRSPSTRSATCSRSTRASSCSWARPTCFRRRTSTRPACGSGSPRRGSWRSSAWRPSPERPS